jgi:hypothetical protein
MFFLHAWSQEMANGLTNQYSLIINSFGFTVLQTTLLGCVTGITAFVSLGIAAWLLAYTKVCISVFISTYADALSTEFKGMDLRRWIYPAHNLGNFAPV